MTINPDTLKTACDALAARDPALARAYAAIGVPEWRTADPVFQSLARTVTFQLLSTKAAGAIWGRVLDWAGGTLDTSHMQTDCDEALRQCGMSRPKIQHLKSIAAAIDADQPNLTALASLSDRDARKALIAVKGIGPWTAEIFLMSSLGRMDAFPEGDVGLMEAFRILRDDEVRYSSKDFTDYAEHWRPFRGAAAHLLWGYINKLREQSY